MHYSPYSKDEEAHCTFKPVDGQSFRAPVVIHLYTKDTALPSKHSWYINSHISGNQGWRKTLADATTSSKKITLDLCSSVLKFEKLSAPKLLPPVQKTLEDPH